MQSSLRINETRLSKDRNATMVFLWELSQKPSLTETLGWCWFCWSHVAPRSFQLISLWTYVMASLCGGKKNKGKKEKKGDSTCSSTKDMSKLCMLLQPMSVRKIRSLHPLSWRQITSYTSGCTGLSERHSEWGREEECWLGSALAKVFPTAGHLGEQQWTACKGSLEI